MDYFAHLATSTGVTKHMWQEPKHNTVNYNLYRKRPECKTVMELTWSEAQKPLVINSIANHRNNAHIHRDRSNHSIYEPYNFDTLPASVKPGEIQDAFTTLCSESGKCRSCSRGSDGVNVDLERIQRLLIQAVEDRRKCILAHPFYNPSRH